MWKEKLSEDTAASPNFRPPVVSKLRGITQEQEFMLRKHFSFNSPHFISEAKKKFKLDERKAKQYNYPMLQGDIRDDNFSKSPFKHANYNQVSPLLR